MNIIQEWNVHFFAMSGDKELIQEVLFDAVVTAPLEAYWTSLVLNKSEYVIHFQKFAEENYL